MRIRGGGLRGGPGGSGWIGRLAVTVGGGLVATAALAGDPPAPPPIKSDRAAEDYSYLLDPAKRSGLWWEPFKALSLNDGGSVYVSFGGEVRYRFEDIRNDDFNIGGGQSRNSYLLQRILLHGDVHVGSNLRVFVQFGSYLGFGQRYDLGPTNDNPAELAQAFADFKLPLGDEVGRLTIRGGRQEMAFGSSRLVSVRDNPNAHRAFDGLRMTFEAAKGGLWDGWTLDGFVTRPVQNLEGSFNDRTNPGQLFSGAYASGPFMNGLVPGLKLDAYYMNLARERALFEDGRAYERRHTVGGRLFGKSAGFDWDVEGAYQFGTFGAGGIDAWTVSGEGGYTFEQLPWAPRLGVRAAVATGDRGRPNEPLGTFNPMFPRLPYFSEASVIAPMNLMDVAPSLTLSPAKDVKLSVTWDFLRKNRAADAVYNSTLTPFDGTAGGSSDIGQMFQVVGEWQATRELTLRAAYVHFFAGRAMTQAGGRDIDFSMVSAALKF